MNRNPIALPPQRPISIAVRSALGIGIAASLLLAGLGTSAMAGERDAILLNAGAIETQSAAVQSQRHAVGEFSGKRLHLVQFDGPIQPEWVQSLQADGLRIVTYIPQYAYLVYGDASSIGRLQSRAQTAQSRVRWDGAYEDNYKFHPDVLHGMSKVAAVAPLERFTVQLVNDPSANATTLARLVSLHGRVFDTPSALQGYVNYSIEIDPSELLALAAQPELVSIHPYVQPRLMDERQDMILAGNLTGTAPTPGDYFSTLASWGFTQAQFNTSGFVVDVTDDGVDVNPTGGIPTNAVAGPVLPNHFVLYESGNRPIGSASPTGTSRVVFKGRWGTAGTDAGLGNSGHGQLNTSIIGGYVPSGTVGGVNFSAAPHADTAGFRYGLGVAPFVKLGNSVIFDPAYTSPAVSSQLSAEYAANTRVSSNSWGSNAGGAYTTDSQTYDALVRDAQSGTPGNQEMIIVFSAGNAGPGVNTMGAPATAKNVIAVAAAENVHSHATAAGGNNAAGNDGCTTPDTDADNPNDIAGFSSRGPTDDGRVKPDISAPGTHITGMAFVTPTSSGTATAVSTYRADGVCALPGGGTVGNANNNFPLGQAWYTTSSGTSHSAPAVSGGMALIYQQFINNPAYIATNRTPAGSAPPSAALAKAYLVNSARYMNGVNANDNLPSNNQGYGMMNLGTAFDGTPRAIRDQVAADAFNASGQLRAFTGTIPDNTKPFRVTLAWTDAPGSTTGNAFVNNLDLTVTAGGNTYAGNVFTKGNSTTGGSADIRNNVESVFLPAGVSGPYTVSVRGTNIAGQGNPAVAGNNQDFALVAYNSSAQASCPAVAVSGPANLPSNVVAGSTYPATVVTGSGGTGPYTFSVIGTLPPGLSFVGDTLSGTPTTGGTYNFTVQTTDSIGCPGVRDYTIIIVSANLGAATKTVTTGNAIIEPNECNALNVVLANTGTFAATAVTSTLSSTTPGVTVDVAASAYPDLPATTGSGTNLTPFQISTAPSVTCGSTINFTQTVNFTGGLSPKTLNFSLPVGQQGGNYTSASSTGNSITPTGTLLPGSQVDDGAIALVLPADFSFQAYGSTIAGGATLIASTNGNLQLAAAGTNAYANAILPVVSTTGSGVTGTFPAAAPTLFPFWDDLDLRNGVNGIYTELTGTAPNRTFKVEWRGVVFGSGGGAVDFAILLTENSNVIRYVYNNAASVTGVGATIGMQAASSGTNFTQFSFNAAAISPTQQLTFTLPAPICSPGPGTCALTDPLFRDGFE